MPARVVVIHDEPEFAGRLVSALRLAGYDVAAFTDPIETWDVIANVQRAHLLITRVAHPPSRSNGVALALKVLNQPDIHVLLTGEPRLTKQPDGRSPSTLGSATIPNIVKIARDLLDFAEVLLTHQTEQRSLPRERQAQPSMPKHEPEVARILQQRRCATCRYWGKREQGVFKTLASRTVPVRRCAIEPKLATFPDDRCNAWRGS
jgi:DNA-binding NtrC family response regulator